MRSSFLLSLIIVLCSFSVKTDRQLLLGTWHLYESLDESGRVTYSSDPEKQPQIIEEILRDATDLPVSKDELRLRLAENFRKTAEMTYSFMEDNELRIFKPGEKEDPSRKSEYALDEEGGTLTLTGWNKKSRQNEPHVYTYKFEGDKLILSGNKHSLVLIR
jgi:hypothetical protein